jgi:cephalosporin hydroxylase
VAFWFEYFQPVKHVGVDIQQKHDSEYFTRCVARKGLRDCVKLYWETDQANAGQMCAIVTSEFSGQLDLVIDDASHQYDSTKASFQTLFPLLRPGGLYVIEDWAWSHWKEFQSPDHPWFHKTPLSALVDELIKVTGSAVLEASAIASVVVFQGFVVVERGKLIITQPDSFRLADHISERLTGPIVGDSVASRASDAL